MTEFLLMTANSIIITANHPVPTVGPLPARTAWIRGSCRQPSWSYDQDPVELSAVILAATLRGHLEPLHECLSIAYAISNLGLFHARVTRETQPDLATPIQELTPWPLNLIVEGCF